MAIGNQKWLKRNKFDREQVCAVVTDHADKLSEGVRIPVIMFGTYHLALVLFPPFIAQVRHVWKAEELQKIYPSILDLEPGQEGF